MPIRSPRVAVVIPAYNAELTLGRALKSVLNQTMADLEVIVVDDCSTDATLEAAAEWRAKDSRITVVGCRKHHGMAYAVNKGVRKSSAPVIARFDATDYSDPGRIAAQLKRFELDLTLAAVGLSNVAIVEPERESYNITLAEKSAEIAVGLLFRAEFLGRTALYRRQVLLHHPFPENIPVGASRLHAHGLLNFGLKVENYRNTTPLMEYHRQAPNESFASEGPESDPMLYALLADLEIKPSVSDLQTHRAGSRSLCHEVGHHPAFQTHLMHNSSLAKQWFGRLEAANLKTNPHVYDTRILGRVLAAQYRKIIELSGSKL